MRLKFRTTSTRAWQRNYANRVLCANYRLWLKKNSTPLLSLVDQAIALLDLRLHLDCARPTSDAGGFDNVIPTNDVRSQRVRRRFRDHARHASAVRRP